MRRQRALCFVSLLLVPWLAAAHVRADRPQGLSAQTVKLPSGPASLRGLGESFAVQPGSGTGSYAVPLELPPGFVRPALALSYSGGKGKGALGLGFELALLSIYRTTDKGSPGFTEQDRFAVSGPGVNDELVPVDRTRGLYRLKNETSFALFVRDAAADTWRIRYPDGQEAFLGLTPDSRQTALGRTFRWFIARHEDRFDHPLEYRYLRDAGQLYVASIRYQLHAREAFQNVVSFHYEVRPDVFADFRYGEAITTRLRMRGVEMRQGPRLMRRYALGYGDEPLHSLLTSITEEGEHGERLPTLRFGYVAPGSGRGGLVAMRSLPPLAGLSSGAATFEDVTGDGLPDLLVTRRGSYAYYENLDGRRWAAAPMAIDACADVSLSTEGVVLADIDGDGRRDVVYPHRPGEELRYCPARETLRGRFLGFGAPRRLQLSEPGVHYGASGVKMADLNADGRIDLLHRKPGQDLSLLNVDDQLLAAAVPELPADADFEDARVGLADFNGDGVLDLVRRELGWERSRVRVWLGLGAGRFAAERTFAAPSGDPAEFHALDVNHDGQEDLVRVSGSWVSYHLNDGQRGYGARQASYYGVPAQSRTRRLTWADMNGNGTVDAVWLTTDGQLSYLELSGVPEAGLLARIDNGMGLVTTLAYRSSSEYAVEAKLRGEPWRTTLPFGVPVVSEVSTTDSLDALGAKATETRVSYDYHDGFYDGLEREFRGFGRVIVSEWGDAGHPTLHIESWFHLGRNLVTLADEEALKGRPYLVVQRDEAGRTLRTQETRWEQTWLCREHLPGTPAVLPGCAGHPDLQAAKDELVAHVRSSVELTGHWEGTAEPRWTAARTEYDAWGQPARQIDYGEVAWSLAREPGEPLELARADVLIGDDESVAETDRLVDVSRWLIGLPTEQRVRSLAGLTLAAARTYYDGDPLEGLPLGQAERGSVSREEHWFDTESAWITVARTAHDTHGLATDMRDAADNRREIAYDDESAMFPVRERVYVDDGTLDFEARHDPGLGALVAARDANGNETRYVYDGLGRIQAVYDPGSADDDPLLRYEYEYGSPERPISRVVTLERRGSAAPHASILFLDAAGRARLTKVEAEAPLGFVASGFTALSARGATAAVFAAFASASTEFEPPSADVPHTTRSFDALGRVVWSSAPASAELPVLATRTDYLPLETRAYDERDTHEGTLAYPAITRFDGLGRPRELERTSERGALVWKARYDARGLITSIVDPLAAAAPERSLRSYRHDSRGKLVDVDDPNLGTLHYEYDRVGNRVRSVDGLGQEQLWEYGRGNRLVRRVVRGDASGAPDYEYRLHYDRPDPEGPIPDAGQLRGRLSWIDYPVGSEHYAYDARGREVSEVVSLWDPARSSFDDQERDVFRRDLQHDDDDKLTVVTLPGGFTVHVDYNARSLARRVTAGFAGDARLLVSETSYDVHGELVRADYGNALRFCRGLDAAGRLTDLAVGKTAELDCGQLASGGLQNLHYQRGYRGQIAAVHDRSTPNPALPRLAATYEYDRLGEVVLARDGFGERRFSYDALQGPRRESFVDAAGRNTEIAYDYGERGAGPSALTTRGGEHYAYDAIGRLEAYRGYALRYDAEGHLRAAERPGQKLSFFYGPGGERRLVIVEEAGRTPRVQRVVFDEYEERDGEQRWIVELAGASVELISSEGLRVDARLLDELALYLRGEQTLKPLPAELLDLDGLGDGFTSTDLELASRAYWTGTTVGTSRLLHRFSHADQLGSHSHGTDSAGDVVAFQSFEVYGGRTAQKGLSPLRGYAGGMNELDEELGLVLFGARYYAPGLRRWITPDLHVGGSPEELFGHALEANLYGYASNDPVNHRDPSGRETAGADAMSSDGAHLVSSREQVMSVAPVEELPLCPTLSSTDPYGETRAISGEGVALRSHDLYDKLPKAGGRVVARTLVYNTDQFAHAVGEAQTDIDGSRLADFYDPANVGPGAEKCGGQPCRIKSGVGQGLRVIATTLSRDPRLARDNPDRYVDPLAWNYTTVPGKSKRAPYAFAGVKVGDAAVIRYRDRVVYGFVADIGNSFKFGESAVRTNAMLNLPFAAVKNGKYKIIGHSARDVEYIYLKNTAHFLRDEQGVLLPQAQIDGIVKGLYERLFGPIRP